MRIEKVAILNEVTARIKESDYCFIVNYGGVDVVKMGALRADLRACDSRLLVVKNSYLAKVAAEKGWSDDVKTMLTGTTAIVTGTGEPTAVAKAIMKFVEGSDGRASVKGADYDGAIVDAKVVEAVQAARPAAVKGVFIKTLTLSSTMGIGVPCILAAAE